MGKEKIVGLLVGGHKLKIVEVENDYKAFKRALGIESPVSVITRKMGGKAFDLWLDDEGLFKENENGEIDACGGCLNAQEFLAGSVLILNSDGENCTSLTTRDIDLITNEIRMFKVDNIFKYETTLGLLRMKFEANKPILTYEI